MEPTWAALTGATFLQYCRELETTQYATPTDVREWQEQRLRRVTAAAAARTPFYAQRFADAGFPSGLRSLDDLSRLPLLTKRDIRAHASEMLAPSRPEDNILEFRTGGSTGVPLVLLISEEISHQRNAASRRSNLWTGWRVGEPVGAVWGNPKLPQTLKERLRHELLDPVIYLDTMQLTPDAVKAFARAWNRERPTMLFGHAHSLYLLARTVAELGIHEIRPRAILATSMMLLAQERSVIEQVFDVKVFDRYGCEEVGMIGCECERHAGMHINVDHLIVEFLDDAGRPVKAGEMGYVVVTDLINDTMPFIRYRIEDMAAARVGSCECGRTMPLMEQVAGRVADFLVRADGSRVAGISLIENSLTKFDGIDQMQIVQEELARIVLNVVPTSAFETEARGVLQDYFEETFPGASVQIEIVPGISREANGKHRFAICRVPA
jgi:phenylacetate-coenzyme A ligase PaaK-like adenylate-forming protein